MSDSANKQVWFCQGCQKVGCVELAQHIDVFSAVSRIEGDHRRVSPGCQTSIRGIQIINNALIRGIQIINNALITSREALVADASIPEWARDPASQFLGFQQNTEEEKCL